VDDNWKQEFREALAIEALEHKAYLRDPLLGRKPKRTHALEVVRLIREALRKWTAADSTVETEVLVSGYEHRLVFVDGRKYRITVEALDE
jgi:hypothetical protein